MDVRTFGELIDWTRNLHAHLARCLAHSATLNKRQGTQALLNYLAEKESEIERMVSEFKHQAPPQILNTWVVDYQSHHPIKAHLMGDDLYAALDFSGICQQVFKLHQQIITLYQTMIGKPVLWEAKVLMESLLAMEQNELNDLVEQVGKMETL